MSAALLAAALLEYDDAAAPRYAQRGDVKGENAGNVTPVGLYVGDGRFINATTCQIPVVREDRLDEPPWSSLYQGARRPR